MVKLFVALGLPDTATVQLAAMRPRAVPGTRLMEPRQMHVTLHFIGESEVQPTAAALGDVACPPLQLTIHGVGQFTARDGSTVLWAGVAATPMLMRLHTAIATALAPLGFQPEARPYTPHVTLARCEPGAGEIIAEFLMRYATFRLEDLTIDSFGLYSSVQSGGTPMYSRERSFPLRETLAGDVDR
jgi:2'-5' RNA ligase